MPTTLLVQEPREGANYQVGEPVRILSVESKISGFALSRASGEGKTHGGSSEFYFDADMSETGRKENSLMVKYSFSFGRVGTSQKCTVRGEAVFRFSRLDPEADLRNLEEQVNNDMAVEIFKRDYQDVYILHDMLGLKAPSPWITQDVWLSNGTA